MSSLLSHISRFVRSHWQQRRQLRLAQSGPGLKVLLFHGLHPCAPRQGPLFVDASLAVSLSFLEKCLRETQAAGFRFIHGDDLGQALVSQERLALLTFDDGYANNLLALPLLKQLNIPALIFVTTDYVIRGRAFWWDVLARETAQRGMSHDAVSSLRRELKVLPPQGIDARLEADFEAGCFAPQGADDRPLTEEELGSLAKESLISIGNHTHRHALLPQLSDRDVGHELQVSQDYLSAIAGKAPTTLAYPNGRWNERVAGMVREMGFRHAFTTERALCPLPLRESRYLAIPRVQPAE